MNSAFSEYRIAIHLFLSSSPKLFFIHSFQNIILQQPKILVPNIHALWVWNISCLCILGVHRTGTKKWTVCCLNGPLGVLVTLSVSVNKSWTYMWIWPMNGDLLHHLLICNSLVHTHSVYKCPCHNIISFSGFISLSRIRLFFGKSNDVIIQIMYIF